MNSIIPDSIILACPMCMSGAEGVLAEAANSAIAVMLCLLSAILMGFLGFIFYLMKRAKLYTGEVPGEPIA